MRNYSIGIFDSGIGGVSLLRAIHQVLPNEHLIYLADTANFPYGEKKESQVLTCVEKILQYFVDRWPIKAILIACNTASVINQKYNCFADLPVLIYDMIQPTVYYVQNHYHNYTNIGIIATPNTINSQIYQRRLPKADFQPQLHCLPTPLLASAVEGQCSLQLQKTIKHYLANPHLQPIQALLLACTHYAWVKNEIKDYYKQQKQEVELIDPINIVAHKLHKDLAKQQLLAEQTKYSKANLFITTSKSANFLSKIQKILPPDYAFELQQI